MKTGFVQNSNYEAMMEGIRYVERRGALEAGMMLVTGDNGLGKTKCIERYVASSGALFVRAVSVHNKRSLLLSLASIDSSISIKGSAKEIQDAIIKYIVKSGDKPSIVIDECQHLARGNSAAMLETVRDISDKAECVVILVAGEIGFQHQLAKFKQISSRIAKHVQFKPMTLADTSNTVRQLSDIIFDDALLQELHKQSSGMIRQVIGAINNLEGFAALNKRSSISLAEVTGKILCEEWQAQRPVRRGA
ncbi:ATP-binding protein [soil metagenome]